MGEVSAVICVSHAPGIRAWPEAAAGARFAAFEAVWARLRARIEAIRPDVIVSFASEHWTNFSLALMPCACIGVGDANEGPVEEWLRVPRAKVPGHPAAANAILTAAYEDGVDLARSHELALDHGTMVPLSYLTPVYDTPVVPILQNCLVAPLPPMRRSARLGQMVRKAIERGPYRAVVVGSGGLSHWPGDLRHGDIDPALDAAFLEKVSAGDVEALCRTSDAELARGGAGMLEVRNWVAAMSAAREPALDVLFYEPFKGFATGCAAAMSPG